MSVGGRAVLEVSEAARMAPPFLTELSDSEPTHALERFRLLRPCLEDGVPLARLAHVSTRCSYAPGSAGCTPIGTAAWSAWCASRAVIVGNVQCRLRSST